jgi:hypothetical protein
MRKCLLLLLVVTLTGCSTIRSPSLTEAAALDTISTQLAINSGNTELNPIGFPATIVAKTGIILYTKQLEEGPKKQLINSLGSSLWTGASVNNILLVLGNTNAFSLFVGIITSFIVFLDITNTHEQSQVQSDNQSNYSHD